MCSPPTSMLGAPLRYITQADLRTFQPINANFGLFPSLPQTVRRLEDRNRLLVERAPEDFRAWQQHLG